MKNEDGSEFHAATVKIEDEFASKESVTDETHWTAVRNLSETSSANEGGTPEEKVKFCKQLIYSHAETLIKIEKCDEDESFITSELVSYLSQDLEVEGDCKTALTVVKREKIEVSFGGTPEEKVKCCKQLIDSHAETLIKIEKCDKDESFITSALVSDLSQDFSKVEGDSKESLWVVKREEIEVSFGDESRSEFNRFYNLEAGNFSEEDICEKLSEACEEKPKAQPSFSPTSLAYMTVVLKDLFPKNCVRGSQEVELLTDDSFPCVYSKGEFRLRERHSNPVVSNSQNSKGSKGNEQRLEIKTPENFENHARTLCDEKPFLCPHCPSTFRHKFGLKQHLMGHNTGKLYSCAHCSKKFVRKGAMANHIAKHLTERPHACPQCAKAFKCKSALKLHSKIHTGEKPYSCSQCSARFSRKEYLRGHLLIHSNEKPYGCDQCPSKFRCKSNLNKHKKTHLVVPFDRCAHCPKQFKTKRFLRLHVLHVHLGMKMEGTRSRILYHCAHCSRQYKAKRYLRSHILYSHQGAVKLYKCRQCRYRSYNPGHLKGHLLSHCDERPFACNHCPAKFKRSAHLKRHEMLHTDETPFSCDKCGKTFRRKDNFKNHSCNLRRAYP